MATATDPVTVQHLQVLNEDSQWDPAALGSRICGVTHDSEDAGFPGKSCLAPGIRIVDDVERIVIPLHDGEPDPVTEQMLSEIGVIGSEEPVRSRYEVETSADFLEEIDIEDLCARWNHEDCLVSRAFRRSVGRQVRCRTKRTVARLERQHSRLGSLSESGQQRYWNCWGQVMTELNKIKTRGGSRPSWVRELHQRLLSIVNVSSQPAVHHSDSTEPPTRAKRPKKKRKTSRQNKKHTSAKTLVHKGVSAFG